MTTTGEIINQPDFLTGLGQIPIKSWQKLKLDFWNTIQLFKQDLGKYSDQQLDVLAKYLDIPNYENLSRADLESTIARSQADISQTANLKVKITTNDIENNIETEVPDSCLKGYEINNILGSGGYGSVYIGKKLNDNNIYAIKFVNLKPSFDRKQNPKKWELDYTHNKNTFKAESDLTKLFSDNKIGVQFYGSWICDSVQIGIIVTEKWDSSIYPLFKKAYIDEINTLKLKLETEPKKLNKDEKNKIQNRINILQNYVNSLVYDICNLSQDIITKLRYQIKKIHELGYIHYDITPANILIKKDSQGKVIDIALTDFGLTRKKTDILNVDPKQHYKFHFNNNPEFYQQVSFDLVQKYPILYDYSFLYYLESCNPGVTPGKYPHVTLIFNNRGLPEKPIKLKKKLITPKPLAILPVPSKKDSPSELQEELNKAFKELESPDLPTREKIIEPIDPTNNDKIIITDIKKPIGQFLGEEILKPNLYELDPDFRQYLLLDHLSTFVVDNQVYKSISEYNKKMFDKFTKEKQIGNKTLTQLFNKGLFAAYTQDLTRRKILLNTLDAQLYYLANDKLIRQTNLENIRKCIKSNLTYSQFFKKIST